jgi:hypothetical protein
MAANEARQSKFDSNRHVMDTRHEQSSPTATFAVVHLTVLSVSQDRKGPMT